MNYNSQISISILYPFIAQSESLGYDRSILWAELGLNKYSCNEASQRIPFTDFINAVNKLVELTSSPALGLLTGGHFHPSTLGPLAYLIMNSPTIEQAFRSFLSYEHMLNEAVSSELIIENQTASHLVSYAGFTDEEVAPIIEAYFSSVLGYMRFLSFRPKFDRALAKEVLFKHQARTDLRQYEEIFGVPVKFGQEVNRMTFENEVMNYEIPGADARIVSRAIVELNAIQATLNKNRQFSNDVYDFIKEGLYGTIPTSTDAANYFAMSVSTFQRRLKDESSTFKGLIERVRIDKSEVYLADLRLTLADVADRLGFASPPAFFKAFKRWTGKTPADYRKYIIQMATNNAKK